jgi:predicted transposase/invertase (TIGR01784 family)
MEYVPIWLREEREEGIKIGEVKGKEEKAIETAKKMIKKGFETDIIMELTGLKKEEVEKLASMAPG